MTHTIHDRLPSGFTFANEPQAEAFAATGSVNGASKVCLVRTDDGERVAIRMRPPRTMADVVSIGRKTTDDVEAYKREYNAGWAASGRPGDSAAWNSGNTSHAWDDGYLDRAAGRAKWHLTWCLDHDICGEG